jgi:hypothetical protein
MIEIENKLLPLTCKGTAIGQYGKVTDKGERSGEKDADD